MWIDHAEPDLDRRTTGPVLLGSSEIVNLPNQVPNKCESCFNLHKLFLGEIALYC